MLSIITIIIQTYCLSQPCLCTLGFR
jgi:hypothetical protein